MKRGIYVLVAGLLMLVLTIGYAYAQVADPIENGTPLARYYAGQAGAAVPNALADAKGLAHSTQSWNLNNNDAFLKYSPNLFPSQGTLAFFANTAVINQPGKTLLDTVGILGARNGDMEIKMFDANRIVFQMYGNGAWHYLQGNVDWTNGYNNTAWNLVAISYGDQGMKMWINGTAYTNFIVGTQDYAGSRQNNYMYFGDNRRDNAIPALNGNNPRTNQPYDIHRGWVGNVDWIRSSATQSDVNLYTIPEPGSIAALLGGLLSSAAIFRRRRV